MREEERVKQREKGVIYRRKRLNYLELLGFTHFIRERLVLYLLAGSMSSTWCMMQFTFMGTCCLFFLNDPLFPFLLHTYILCHCSMSLCIWHLLHKGNIIRRWCFVFFLRLGTDYAGCLHKRLLKYTKWVKWGSAFKYIRYNTSGSA